MDANTQAQFRDHLTTISSLWSDKLSQHQFDGALIAAGTNTFYYDDDQSPPFHANPHFLRWTVAENSEHCLLLLNGNAQPKLLWYCPADYWYLPSSTPDWLLDHFDCENYSTRSDLEQACVKHLTELSRVAYFGTTPTRYVDLDNVELPPKVLQNQLAYARGYKTPFEVAQISKATDIAVQGHLAAYDCFEAGGSEFAIHLAYQERTKHVHHDLPYPNIVALNEHSSTLHYQHYDRDPPATRRSFLIDAGAKNRCYHSDITRSYSANPKDEFADLVSAVDEAQQSLITHLPSLSDFVEFHEHAHLGMAEVLVAQGIVTCSAVGAFEQQLTDIFYPHGTGHLLGLQTHDVGGHIVEVDGTEGTPPTRFPSLRLVRLIEEDLVFTVEPGIYFIPVLLDRVRGHQDINWSLVENFVPFGGVRIEDNVLVESNGIRNITRAAFSAA
ncbi:MAG: Xaa-Pro dipeptidase [Gammaproteobacteria bacterium]|nr:Xaa-Pro dipeptidase [Gammaproteobacteria bacterium]